MRRALAVFGAIGVVGVLAAGAQQATFSRVVLQQADLSVAGREAVTAVATLPPTVSSGRLAGWQYPALAAIADSSIAGMNERDLATECLMPAEGAASTRGPLEAVDGGRPFYELYGEQIVANGAYQEVIRYRQHVQPIGRALAAL